MDAVGGLAGDVRLARVSLEVGVGRARRTLLADVSGTFAKGEVTCIVGASGSGKSTILRAICGLQATDGGQVLVDGRDVGSLTPRERVGLRRTTVTMVEQDYNLLETLTARENILLLRELAGQPPAEALVDQWLDRLGLRDVRDEYPVTLSGGEQQRVAIARSLAAPHPIVLADEPTGALDEANSGAVTAMLREFAAAGKCCIVVTHDATVARAADRLLTLREGNLT